MDWQGLKEIVKRKEEELRCNCDLDNWEPDKRTGHSWVCRIHNEALDEFIEAWNP